MPIAASTILAKRQLWVAWVRLEDNFTNIINAIVVLFGVISQTFYPQIVLRGKIDKPVSIAGRSDSCVLRSQELFPEV